RWELAFEDENPVSEPPGHAAEGHAAGKARPSDGQQGGARQPFAIVVADSHVLCLASARDEGCGVNKRASSPLRSLRTWQSYSRCPDRTRYRREHRPAR